MSIATRTGDDGNTHLNDGRRVGKDDHRIEAIGALDEVNAALGLVRVSPIPVAIDIILERVQSDLCDLSAEVGTPREATEGTKREPLFHAASLDLLEADLQALEDRLPPHTAPLLPGGHHGAALLHVARTQCRLAERRVVTLARHERITGIVLHYLNRLSDLLFLMAREVNVQAGHPEPEWQTREIREQDQH